MSRERPEERECPICGTRFRPPRPNYMTCGSPRCQRMYRAQRESERKKGQLERAKQRKAASANEIRAIAKMLEMPVADEAAQRRIVQEIHAEVAMGRPETDAISFVAIRLRETPASVISVWRARK